MATAGRAAMASVSDHPAFWFGAGSICLRDIPVNRLVAAQLFNRLCLHRACSLPGRDHGASAVYRVALVSLFVGSLRSLLLGFAALRSGRLCRRGGSYWRWLFTSFFRSSPSKAVRPIHH